METALLVLSIWVVVMAVGVLLFLARELWLSSRDDSDDTRPLS